MGIMLLEELEGIEKVADAKNGRGGQLLVGELLGIEKAKKANF